MGASDTALQNNSDNQAINAQDTGHDDGDQRLVNELLFEDADGGDANAGLCGAISRAEVAEDQGRGDTHKTEEGILVRVVV